jgi:hypothetical protein
MLHHPALSKANVAANTGGASVTVVTYSAASRRPGRIACSIDCS